MMRVPSGEAKDGLYRAERPKKMKTERNSNLQPRGLLRAFTIVELLVVIGTIGILTATLLPALAKSRQKVPAAQCQSNLKQLALGWILYSTENQDILPVNGGEGYQPSAPDPSIYAQWCPGRVDSGTGKQPTNTAWIKAGQIYPFVNDPSFYRCPSDPSTYVSAAGVVYPRGGKGDPRVRSVSMNAYMNPDPNSGMAASPFTCYRKDTDLAHPGAANLWVFTDQNPYNINDDYILVEPSNNTNPPTGNIWYDCPGSFHGGSGSLAFADGHAQIRKWRDPVVLLWSGVGVGEAVTTPHPELDLNWLLSHTTIHN